MTGKEVATVSGGFSSQVKSLQLGGSVNDGFTEVSHSSYGRLSLVVGVRRKRSAQQALGLGERTLWQQEAPLLLTSTFTKKYFLAPGKNHVGEKHLCS